MCPSSSVVPTKARNRPLRYRDVPDWAHQHPRFYALLLADEHLTDALIELSRVVGYPGDPCPEDK